MNFLATTRIISLLAVCAVLQACSAVKIAYNQAPALAYLYLDGYADFNDVQTAQVKAELVKFQGWHRQTQLPAYIDLLQKVQPIMLQDITQPQACEVFAEVRKKVTAMTDYAEPATASLVAAFTPNQLAAMERKFAKSNAKWRDDFLDGSAKEQFEKRHKKAINRGEMLYGSINDKQRGLIAEQIGRSQFKAAQSYAERQRRQKDILQTLGKLVASPQDQDSLRKEMMNLMTRSVASPDATYRSYLDQNIQTGCANFAELHNTTTPEQRKNAVDVLAGYARDFKTLVAQK